MDEDGLTELLVDLHGLLGLVWSDYGLDFADGEVCLLHHETG